MYFIDVSVWPQILLTSELLTIEQFRGVAVDASVRRHVVALIAIQLLLLNIIVLVIIADDAKLFVSLTLSTSLSYNI